MFRKNGQKIRGEKLYADESLLEDLPKTGDRFIGDQIFGLLAGLEKSRQEYVAEIIRHTKRFKEARYLISIPGIGNIQAAKIISQVVDPGRFADKYKFYSYCGLVRHPKDSGGKSYGTTKIWGNRILKCVYKMAGHSALKGNSRLRLYYDALREKGTKHENAYNAVCRKIAAISLSLWKNSQRYDDNKVHIKE